MDEVEGDGAGTLKKKKLGTGEVDFKEKSGTAWSHSFLNQKPWHPLSYPNQRRKWIAEQTDAQHQRRAEEVAREFAQEQEFFRQSALISKKEKEKVEIMKAVSFMYVRPPGYNAESAKAAELEDERRKSEGSCPPQPSTNDVPAPSSMPQEEKKKSRPKDVYGRALPTEEEFDALKNAPRMETGLPARPKPFGIEIRNVKCLRCGTYGHQSGDRECPLKDAIMPNEEKRLKRDDPLTSIMAHVDTNEPLKWELKQKPGMSPPRGGFKPDDPNQQIVAEDIFDEYGGFLGEVNIPDLLTNFSIKKDRKHSKSKTKHKSPSKTIHTDHKVLNSEPSSSYTDSSRDKSTKKRNKKKKHKKHRHTNSSDSSDIRRHDRSEHRYSVTSSSDDSESPGHHKRSKPSQFVPPDKDQDMHHKRNKHRVSVSPDDSYYDKHHKRDKVGRDDSDLDRLHKRRRQGSVSSDNARNDGHHKRKQHRHSVSPEDSYYDRHHKTNKHTRSSTQHDSKYDRHHRRHKPRHSISPSDSEHEMHQKRNKHQVSASSDDSECVRKHKRNEHRKHGSHHRRH